MKALRRFWIGLLMLVGCNPAFVDTTVSGVPNLHNVAPRLWQSGQPADVSAWVYLRGQIAPPGAHVTIVKLNDDAEGDDTPAQGFVGWRVVRVPMPPFDNEPWTVLNVPATTTVNLAVATVVEAYKAGEIVLWHCSHGRDRSSLVGALVGKALFGWNEDQMEAYMNSRGFRWVDIDLSIYFKDNT